MDLLDIIALTLGSSGVVGAGVTIYQVNRGSSDSQAKTEIEANSQASADWSSFAERIQALLDRQDRKIEAMETRMKILEKLKEDDAEYIDLLVYWIWNGISPPPPKRGDPYPDLNK